MTKLVVLKFSGSLESGFLVNSEIGREGKSVDRGCTGKLPPARELNYYLTNWQQHYKQLGNNPRIKPQKIIYDGSSNRDRQLIESAQKLQQALHQWLDSHSFNTINKHLREELNRSESVRILICSDRPEIHQLPWCCWDLVESYPNLEIAVSSPNFARVPVMATSGGHQRVKILAILGDSEGINLDADRNFLKTIDTGEAKFLVEPTIPELYDCLWHESWDIVFFAGHSKTEDRQGILYLNAQDRLTIAQLKPGFKQAIASGLQLAIFNSCDGLGLAEELGQLSLPQSIVMRLPIPDEMAQQFVKYFLQAYAGGNSLYLAMRQAREQLQSYEKQFPYASWLPIIYQNPAVTPPQWSDFCHRSLLPTSLKFRPSKQFWGALTLITAIATAIVWLLQFWGLLQPGELNAYDRLMVLGYSPPVNQKVLVVTVDDRDLTYQQEQNMALNMRGSLADAALDLLVQKLNLGQARAIALDIIHDFPFNPELAETIAKTDNFVAICRVRNLPELVSVAPPSQLDRQQLGFSNWAIDNDGSIRRQIIGMSPDNVCNSSFSLSLRLALKYLGDVPTKFNSRSPLSIGQVTFPKLMTTSGGYHLPEAQGYQILLNYRQAAPATIFLREILTMPQAKVDRLVKDKIVLIGVTGHNQDLHHTPYSRGQQAKRFSGVMIHALMTSQIVNVVTGEQKLLKWVSSPLEVFWIACWSIVGTVIIWQLRSPIKILLAIATALALLFCCCWLLLINGIWLVAIAPALTLIISAIFALAYRQRQFMRN